MALTRVVSTAMADYLNSGQAGVGPIVGADGSVNKIGAALRGIEDNVASLETAATQTRRMGIPLGVFTREDGTPLVKAAATVVGFAQAGNTDRRIRWAASPGAGEEAISFDYPLPADFDRTVVSYLKVCTGKSANADTTRTLGCEIYPVGPADVENANVVTAPGTAVVTELYAAAAEKTYTIAASAIPAGARSISGVLTIATDVNSDAQDIMYVDLLYTPTALS